MIDLNHQCCVGISLFNQMTKAKMQATSGWRFSTSCMTLFVVTLVTVGAHAQTITAVEAKQFFETYVTLSHAYDPAVAELYSDTARVRSLRRYGTQGQRAIEIEGGKWKTLVQAAMPLAKAKGDRSEFKNPRFELMGTFVRVRAERYSVLRCYSDQEYYMVLERQTNGSLRIVEEYVETQPESNC